MYKDVSIGDFVLKYEKVYGSILDNKAHFVKIYNLYRHANKPQWGTWSWEAYEHFVRIPNHTRIQHPEGINAKMQKAISLLPKNVIYKITSHE